MSSGHFGYKNLELCDCIDQLILDTQETPPEERDATKTMRRMILCYTLLVDRLLIAYDKYMSSDFSEESFLEEVENLLRNHKWDRSELEDYHD